MLSICFHDSKPHYTLPKERKIKWDSQIVGYCQNWAMGSHRFLTLLSCISEIWK